MVNGILYYFNYIKGEISMLYSLENDKIKITVSDHGAELHSLTSQGENWERFLGLASWNIGNIMLLHYFL